MVEVLHFPARIVVSGFCCGALEDNVYGLPDIEGGDVVKVLTGYCYNWYWDFKVTVKSFLIIGVNPRIESETGLYYIWKVNRCSDSSGSTERVTRDY